MLCTVIVSVHAVATGPLMVHIAMTAVMVRISMPNTIANILADRVAWYVYTEGTNLSAIGNGGRQQAQPQPAKLVFMMIDSPAMNQLVGPGAEALYTKIKAYEDATT